MQRVDGIDTVCLSNHNNDAVAYGDETRTRHIQLSAIGKMNREWFETITDFILDPLNVHTAIEPMRYCRVTVLAATAERVL